MLGVAVRLVADTALVATLLFASAGTLAWWRAWLLLAVLLLIWALGARGRRDPYPEARDRPSSRPFRSIFIP